MSMITRSFFLLACLGLCVACASEDEEDAVSQTNPPMVPMTPTGGGRALLSIPVTLAKKGRTSLSLANATSYTIELAACASQYHSTATETSSNLQVYSFDRGCLAKLTQFSINGFTYTPVTGSNFTTWQANDTALFEVSSDPTNQLSVKVISTLSDPVQATDAVAYQFSDIVKGSDETLGKVDVGDAHTMSVSGQAAPSFTIHSVEMVGITSPGGAGQFDFVLECTSNITGAGNTTACLDSLYVDLKYKLVKDTYGSTLNYAQAQSLFSSGTSSVDPATDTVAVGAGGTTHGGFNTVTLDGPDQIHNNPNMILVIEVAGLSYLYFNVDITTLTQD